MSYLHGFDSKNIPSEAELTKGEKFSILYHSIFDYPLSFSELIKWKFEGSFKFNKVSEIDIDYKNGFYFIKGKECLLYKRKTRERISKKKIEYAKKATKLISFIPSVKFVGLTGSLAMNNAEEGSDIDLIIITKKGHLWSSRMFTYFLLKTMGYEVRKPKQMFQKDKLCLNMWLDESDLVWPSKNRNIYTAHEILQIVPLLTKENIFEKLLKVNKWVLKYWPNVVKIPNTSNKFKDMKLNSLSLIENLLFKIQHFYMKKKITKEQISQTKAIFHPRNLSKQILAKIRP
mgnify:CR=1 FL=1